MRRGLLNEVCKVFEAAIEMVGGTVPPDKMEDERERIGKLRAEVLFLLQEGDKLKINVCDLVKTSKIAEDLAYRRGKSDAEIAALPLLMHPEDR